MRLITTQSAHCGGGALGGSVYRVGADLRLGHDNRVTGLYLRDSGTDAIRHRVQHALIEGCVAMTAKPASSTISLKKPRLRPCRFQPVAGRDLDSPPRCPEYADLLRHEDGKGKRAVPF